MYTSTRGLGEGYGQGGGRHVSAAASTHRAPSQTWPAGTFRRSSASRLRNDGPAKGRATVDTVPSQWPRARTLSDAREPVARASARVFGRSGSGRSATYAKLKKVRLPPPKEGAAPRAPRVEEPPGLGAAVRPRRRVLGRRAAAERGRRRVEGARLRREVDRRGGLVEARRRDAGRRARVAVRVQMAHGDLGLVEARQLEAAREVDGRQGRVAVDGDALDGVAPVVRDDLAGRRRAGHGPGRRRAVVAGREEPRAAARERDLPHLAARRAARARVVELPRGQGGRWRGDDGTGDAAKTRSSGRWRGSSRGALRRSQTRATPSAAPAARNGADSATLRDTTRPPAACAPTRRPRTRSGARTSRSSTAPLPTAARRCGRPGDAATDHAGVPPGPPTSKRGRAPRMRNVPSLTAWRRTLPTTGSLVGKGHGKKTPAKTVVAAGEGRDAVARVLAPDELGEAHAVRPAPRARVEEAPPVRAPGRQPRGAAAARADDLVLGRAVVAGPPGCDGRLAGGVDGEERRLVAAPRAVAPRRERGHREAPAAGAG